MEMEFRHGIGLVFAPGPHGWRHVGHLTSGMGSDGSFTTDPDEFEEYYDFFNGGGVHPGHDLNPYTGEPYETQLVPVGITRDA